MTSEHAPIASQTDFIEVHNSAQSARKTIINSSRSNFTILKIIRRDEYISLITEFDSLRLAAFFRSMARPVTNSPSITRGFNYYPGNPSASSCYFKRDYLDSRISQAEHLPTGGDGRQMPPFEIQRAIIMNRVPATREDAATMLSAAGLRFALPFDFRKLWEGDETFLQVAERLLRIATEARSESSNHDGEMTTNARARDLVCLMVAKDIILIPLKLPRAFRTIFKDNQPYLFGESAKQKLLDELERQSKADGRVTWQIAFRLARAVVMSSTISHPEDISLEFIEAIEGLMAQFLPPPEGPAKSSGADNVLLSDLHLLKSVLVATRNASTPSQPIELARINLKRQRTLIERRALASEARKRRREAEAAAGLLSGEKKPRKPTRRDSTVPKFPDGTGYMLIPEIVDGLPGAHPAVAGSPNVLFNNSIDGFVITRPISFDCFRDLVASFEAIRLGDFFDKLSQLDPDNPTALFAWRQQTGKSHPATLYWWRKEALEVRLGLDHTSSYTDLAVIASALPLEEQRTILESMKSVSHREARACLSSMQLNKLFPISLSLLPTRLFENLAWLRLIASLAITPGNKLADHYAAGRQAYNGPLCRDFLRYLVGRGHLLFPLVGPKNLKDPIYEAHLDIYIDEHRRSFLQSIASEYSLRAASNATRELFFMLKSLLLASTLKDSSGLSAELLQEFELAWFANEEQQNVGKSALGNKRGIYRRAIDVILTVRVRELPDQRIIYVPFGGIRAVGNWQGGRSKGFEWAEEKNPALSGWTSIFHEYVAIVGTQVKQLKPVRRALNFWLDYLLFQQSPPLSPYEVIRSTHIANSDPRVSTYTRILELSPASNSTRNNSLRELYDFFEWIRRKELEKGNSFGNPVYFDIDRWQQDASQGQTHRLALNQDQIDRLKEIISKDDFEFCKDKKKFPRDFVTVLDNECGELVEAWFPGRARALHTMLCLPLRSFQTLWMDSGEGDELEVIFSDGPNPASPVTRPNSHPNRTRDRNMGPFRLTVESDGLTYIGLYIPTNKTNATYKKKEVGHLFPWVDDEVIKNIRAMQLWQRRYGFPISSPVEAIFEEREERFYTTKVMVFPLFRDPTRKDKSLPVSRTRLQNLFYEALIEADRFERQKNPSLPPMAVRKSEGLAYESEYDLHSLRVSGITNLLEAGVPLEVVSRYMAGHHSLVMTLWYNKIELKRVRQQLMAARNSLVATDVGLTEPLVSSDRRRIDRTTSGDNSLIRDATWRVKIDGICPGARCAEGVIDGFGNPAPVPDNRCSLCRFHLTGPRFLVGNTILMNDILRRVHARQNDMRELQESLNVLIASRADGAAVAQGEINIIEGRITQLRNAQRLDLLDLAARKGVIEASKKLTAEDNSMALLAPGSQSELSTQLRTGLHAENLHFLSLATEIIPGYRNDEAVREFRDVIENLLFTNGVLPPLAALTKSELTLAINLFGDLLFSVIELEDQRIATLSGSKRLADFHCPDGRTLEQVFSALGNRITALKSVGEPLTAEGLANAIGTEQQQ